MDTRELRQGGALWKAARMALCDITASELVEILGVLTWRPRKDIYLKLAMGQPKEHSHETRMRMAWGTRCEAGIRDAAIACFFSPYFGYDKASQTGLHIRSTLTGNLVLGASPDGLLGRDALLEIKASCPKPGMADETDVVMAVPYYDVPQCLAQMFVCGRNELYYVRHNGICRMAVFRLEFDQATWEYIEKVVNAFFVDHVRPRKPPGRNMDRMRTVKVLQDYVVKHTEPMGDFDYRPEVSFEQHWAEASNSEQ